MNKETKILIGILVVVAGGLIGLFVLANHSGNTGTGPSPSGSQTVVRPDSHKQGSGPVQMVEFGDFQCPACGAAEPNVQQLLKDYSGKITFYFRNFPLQQHQNAQAAAEAAEAAGDQGQYWPMHDKLYATQSAWEYTSDPTGTFIGYAQALGLDTAKFKQALQSRQFAKLIAQDLADGQALGINATPTFFFNGQKFSGNNTYPALRDEVQSLLK